MNWNDQKRNNVAISDVSDFVALHTASINRYEVGFRQENVDIILEFAAVVENLNTEEQHHLESGSSSSPTVVTGITQFTKEMGHGRPIGGWSISHFQIDEVRIVKPK